MKRIAIDNNIVDRIMETPELLRAIQRAAEGGVLVIVATHLLRDGLAETRDAERRRRLLATCDALPKEEVPTRGFVLGVTALGGGELVSEETAAVLERLRTGGRGGWKDALIAATAEARADVLVTEDGDLATRAKAVGLMCEIWSLEDFARFVPAESARGGDERKGAK